MLLLSTEYILKPSGTGEGGIGGVGGVGPGGLTGSTFPNVTARITINKMIANMTPPMMYFFLLLF